AGSLPTVLQAPAAPDREPRDDAPLPSVPAQLVSGGPWEALGPAPVEGGQSITQGNQVEGAVHCVAPHPTNPDILYVGATNGGIWRADDATAARPTWRPLTDRMPSLSIGALALDVDAPDVIVAGIGRFSSFSFR